MRVPDIRARHEPIVDSLQFNRKLPSAHSHFFAAVAALSQEPTHISGSRLIGRGPAHRYNYTHLAIREVFFFNAEPAAQGGAGYVQRPLLLEPSD